MTVPVPSEGHGRDREEEIEAVVRRRWTKARLISAGFTLDEADVMWVALDRVRAQRDERARDDLVKLDEVRSLIDAIEADLNDVGPWGNGYRQALSRLRRQLDLRFGRASGPCPGPRRNEGGRSWMVAMRLWLRRVDLQRALLALWKDSCPLILLSLWTPQPVGVGAGSRHGPTNRSRS